MTNNLTANFSTFVNNTASGSGKSLFHASTGFDRLNGNVLSSPGGGNCAGSVLSRQYNFVASTAGNDTSCGPGALGEITLTTPSALNLGPLADNGGPTWTMLPGAGSPLLGAAPDALGTGITTDQRGVTRTVPFTVGSVQPVSSGPTGLMVRWVPGTIMARWSPVSGATSYRATLVLRPKVGAASTRRTTTSSTNAQWLVKPAPKTPYTVCVRAWKAGAWGGQTCKDSTVGATGWRDAGKGLPVLSGRISAGTH